jgi:hypothetical protein
MQPLKHFILIATTCLMSKEAVQAQVMNTYYPNGTYNPHAYQEWSDKKKSDEYQKLGSKTAAHPSSDRSPTRSSGSSTSSYDPYALLSSPDVRKSAAFARTHADSVYWGIENRPATRTVVLADPSVYKKDYDYMQPNFEDGLCGVRKDKKWGFINENGKIIIPLEYDAVFSFHEGMGPVMLNGKVGYFNNDGVLAIPLIYEDGDRFDYGLAKVKHDGKWGFIDKEGAVYIPFEYDGLHNFDRWEKPYPGLVSVKKNGKWGFINKTNDVVIPFVYDKAGTFSNGHAEVEQGSEKFEIDITGKKPDKSEEIRIAALKSLYDRVADFKEDLALVSKGGLYGFVDKQYSLVIPLKYSDANDFKEGLALVKQNEKYGFINQQGIIVIPLEYSNANSFNNGLAAVNKDGSWGYIDKNGTLVISPKYSKAYDFEHGFAVVVQSRKFGIIDTKGKIIVPVIYDECADFSDEIAAVKKDKKWGYVNNKGAVIVPIQYDAAEFKFPDGLALVQKDNKFGFINNKGIIVVPLEYDEADGFKYGFSEVQLNGEKFKIDNTGKRVR